MAEESRSGDTQVAFVVLILWAIKLVLDFLHGGNNR